VTQTTPDLTMLHVFSTFRVGGPQVRFADIANHFGGRYRHLIVAMDEHYDCRSRIEPSIAVGFPSPPVRKGHSLTNIMAFRKALRALRPDLLVTYNWGSIEWAVANWPGRIRHIHIEDGFGPEEAQRQFRRRIWARRLLLTHSTVVVPSRTLDGIAKDVWGLDPRRVRYIPNGIDCARFSGPRDAALSSRWPGSGPVIGTVAALRDEKNLARLLRAFHLASARHACRLVIVGDGPERAALEALAIETGISDRVSFAGHVADPAALYRAFDVFALSSDTEQMPLTIIEAMAAGLPIAATDVGDIKQMVAGENLPFLVLRSDEALGDALGELAADAETRRRIGDANQTKARREYGHETMFAAFGAIFQGNELPQVRGCSSGARATL
jgi:glycosyltransferase involved in cell wall biosynthesis